MTKETFEVAKAILADINSLKNIKADSFIENLLEEINDRHLEKIYIIVLIILFSLAMIILILDLKDIFLRLILLILK